MAEHKRTEEMTRLRNTGTDELLLEVEQIQRRLLDLRFQAAAGQLDDTMAIRTQRKTIARIRTVLRERELAAVEEI